MVLMTVFDLLQSPYMIRVSLIGRPTDKAIVLGPRSNVVTENTSKELR